MLSLLIPASKLRPVEWEQMECHRKKQTNGKTNKRSEKLHSHIRKCGNNLSCELEKKRWHDPGSIFLFSWSTKSMKFSVQCYNCSMILFTAVYSLFLENIYMFEVANLRWVKMKCVCTNINYHFQFISLLKVFKSMFAVIDFFPTLFSSIWHLFTSKGHDL